MIDDGEHGLLADFYDVDGLAEQALEVLRTRPGSSRWARPPDGHGRCGPRVHR